MWYRLEKERGEDGRAGRKVFGQRTTPRHVHPVADTPWAAIRLYLARRPRPRPLESDPLVLLFDSDPLLPCESSWEERRTLAGGVEAKVRVLEEIRLGLPGQADRDGTCRASLEYPSAGVRGSAGGHKPLSAHRRRERTAHGRRTCGDSGRYMDRKESSHEPHAAPDWEVRRRGRGDEARVGWGEETVAQLRSSRKLAPSVSTVSCTVFSGVRQRASE